MGKREERLAEMYAIAQTAQRACVELGALALGWEPVVEQDELTRAVFVEAQAAFRDGAAAESVNALVGARLVHRVAVDDVRRQVRASRAATEEAGSDADGG